MKKLIFSISIIYFSIGVLFAQQPITGGHQINISEAPWQVLLKLNGSYGCGGSIIAPNIILTAKHCVIGLNPNSVQVVAGITCKDEVNNSNIFNVRQIVVHPTLDVAILILDSNIPVTTKTRSINFKSSSDGQYYNVGNKVSVSGWGWLTPDGYDPSQCLNSVDVNIISNTTASIQLGKNVSSYEVATAGVGNIRKGACHGDSGGPLVVWSDILKDYVLIGVVSWGRAHCTGDNTNSPSVFVRVSKLISWINQYVPSHDLLIRDNEQDIGLEPNPTFKAWRSPDIWLADSSFKEIPIYNIYKYKSCYIAIRVKNIGHATSTGTEKVYINWSNSSLRSYWPFSWMQPSIPFYSKSIATGKTITEDGIDIPSLKPKEEITLYVLWNIVSNIPEFEPARRFWWGFALLARIVNNYGEGAYNYPFPNPLTTTYAKYFNGFAINDGSQIIKDNIYMQMSSLCHIDKPFTIRFNQLETNGKYRLSDFAEIYVVLSNDLMKNLNKETSKGIKIIDKTTVLLQSANAELYFNALDKKEGNYFIGAKVHFISDKMPEYNEFNFDMTLKVQDEPEETLNFTAIRNENIFFKADAQADKKKIVKAREEVTLQSNIIDDNASYVWFDQNGNQIGEGSKITVMPQISQKYKVVITKEEDGYRSYDEVEVIAVDGIIKSLSPNPVHNELKVIYELSDNINTISANIQISNIQQTVVIDYPIDPTSKDKTISISGYNTGAYIVKLLINGKVVDTQNLIIY